MPSLIKAEEWNRLMQFLAENQLLGVLDLSKRSQPHPWRTRAKWDPRREGWSARIRPGFVIGPQHRVDVALDLPAGNPLPQAAMNQQKHYRRTTGTEAPGRRTYLSERPEIPLPPFRRVGTDAEPLALEIEPVPPYFLKKGVLPTAAVNADFDSGTLTTEAQTGEPRLLRACDLVLTHDRPAAVSQWITGAGIDGTFAQFDVTYRPRPGQRREAYLHAQTARFLPELEAGAADSFEDLLNGRSSDPGRDQRRVATIYLLSPKGEPAGSEPDARWRAYTRHWLWWNPHYDLNRPAPPPSPNNLTLTTGLAGGILDAINNSILAAINDRTNALAQYVQRAQLSGKFWT